MLNLSKYLNKYKQFVEDCKLCYNWLAYRKLPLEVYEAAAEKVGENIDKVIETNESFRETIEKYENVLASMKHQIDGLTISQGLLQELDQRRQVFCSQIVASFLLHLGQKHTVSQEFWEIAGKLDSNNLEIESRFNEDGSVSFAIVEKLSRSNEGE